jgi:hypothetical protein
MILQASEMAIESILKWPVFSQAAPHLIPAFQLPLIEVCGRPEPNSWNQNLPSSCTLPDLDLETINRLVHNFLDHNYVKNPIFDIQSIWASAREFAESGPQWDAKSCLLVRASVPHLSLAPDHVYGV